jgi:hypothetical protein
MSNVNITRTANMLGWALTVFSAFAMIANGAYTFFGPREAVRQMVEMGGMTMAQAPAVAMINAVCGILYAIPRTSVLGAILATAFYGGAVAIEFRIGGTPYLWVNILFAAMAWGGLYLRDPRLRTLLPLTLSAI